MFDIENFFKKRNSLKSKQKVILLNKKFDRSLTKLGTLTNFT